MIRRALYLLERNERRNLFAVMFVLVLKGLVDVVGVASVVPFLSVISNPSSLRENNIISRFVSVTGLADTETIVMFLGFVVLALMFASALVRALATYVIARFTEMRSYTLQRRLLQTYLRQPYQYYLSAHSGDIATNILAEAPRVVHCVFRPAADLANHSVTLVLLLVLVLFADPVVTISAAFGLGGAYVVVFMIVRPIIRRLSDRIVESNKQRFRIVQEVFSGVKQVKLAGLEGYYVDLFSVPAENAAESNATNMTLQRTPRFALEFLAFGGIIALTLLLLARFGGVEAGGFAEVVPILGLYAFAGYRLLPALQGIYLSASQLKSGVAPLHQVYSALKAGELAERLPAAAPEPMLMERALEVRGISFTYPGGDPSSPSLKDVTLSIERGASVGVVGTTGAGKTTLMDVFLGLLRPQVGEVRVDDVVLDDGNIRRWRASVGYVPQDIYLTSSSVARNIAFGVPPEEIDQKKVERAARLAQIHEFITTELVHGYDTNVGERGVRLSGGQRQRIGIARALYNDPELLVFDEATSALDNVTERDLMKGIEALSGAKTVVMIAHRMSTVRKCDKIVVLEGGRLIAQGAYDQLKAESEAFQRLVENS